MSRVPLLEQAKKGEQFYQIFQKKFKHILSAPECISNNE